MSRFVPERTVPGTARGVIMAAEGKPCGRCSESIANREVYVRVWLSSLVKNGDYHMPCYEIVLETAKAGRRAELLAMDLTAIKAPSRLPAAERRTYELAKKLQAARAVELKGMLARVAEQLDEDREHIEACRGAEDAANDRERDAAAAPDEGWK